MHNIIAVFDLSGGGLISSQCMLQVVTATLLVSAAIHVHNNNELCTIITQHVLYMYIYLFCWFNHIEVNLHDGFTPPQ